MIKCISLFFFFLLQGPVGPVGPPGKDGSMVSMRYCTSDSLLLGGNLLWETFYISEGLILQQLNPFPAKGFVLLVQFSSKNSHADGLS